ncbi:MAG: hypothetical protein H8D23_33185 [Candidatus Brocadiales bacterium]|nr:hypothetical protein [Candidatus Brocadiales bacterium]
MLSQFRLDQERSAFVHAISKIIVSIKEDDPEVKKKRYAAVLHEIRRRTSHYVLTEDMGGLQQLITYLRQSVSSFQGMSKLQKQTLDENLVREVILYYDEQQSFKPLPVEAFQKWYSVCIGHELKYRNGVVLLAVIWGAVFREEGSSKQYIQQLCGFDAKTVTAHVEKLLADDLIFINQEVEIKTLYLFNATISPVVIKLGSIFKMIPNALFNSSGLIHPEVHGLEYVGYLYARPRVGTFTNPFPAVTREKIYFHHKLLNIELFIACILSEDLLQNWLNVSHHPRSTIIEKMMERVHGFTQEILYTKPLFTDKHFKQIEKVQPLARYIATRELHVSIEELDQKIAYYMWVKQDAISKFSESYSFFSEKFNVDLSWDYEYFFLCLENNKPLDKWRKEYPDIQLLFLPQNANERLLGYELLPLPDGLSLDEVLILSSKLIDGHHIERFINAHRYLAHLSRIRKNIVSGVISSFSFTPSIIEIITHGNFFVGSSPQTIPKTVKPIFQARNSHQFVMIDIRQMYLEVLKGYARCEPIEKGDQDVADLTFEKLVELTGAERKVVKKSVYIPLFGGGIRTAVKETGVSHKAYKEIQKAIKSYGQISSFYQKVNAMAKTEGLTLATPLGFRIPVFKKKRLARGYVIQATANEIIREWMLCLNDVNLSRFIVNTIHDEIVFSVPLTTNLYEFGIEVQEQLTKAIGQLKFDTCILEIKVTSAKRWDPQSAVEIILPQGKA